MLGGIIERVATRVEIDEWQALPSPNRQLFPWTPFSPRQVALSSSFYPDTAGSGVLRRCLPPGTGVIIGQSLVQVKRVCDRKGSIASDDRFVSLRCKDGARRYCLQPTRVTRWNRATASGNKCDIADELTICLA